jgi:hypothetical protein
MPPAKGDSGVHEFAIRFVDDAASAGIDFRYFNGFSPATAGYNMFAIMGGGVAAFDYDGDFWPDLYFTQGCRWPPHESGGDYRNRIYLNLGNGRFRT